MALQQENFKSLQDVTQGMLPFHFLISLQLSELFESQVDQVMQGLGFCCGHEYSYQQILYCSSANVCTINRDANYYVYENR